MKKSLLLTVLLCAFVFSTYAQRITISSFIVKHELPADINLWGADAVNGAATGGNNPIDYLKMVIQVKRSGAIVCGNTPQTTQSISGFVTKAIRTNDITAALGNCTLQPGQYTLCIQFFDMENLSLGNEQCRDFTVASPVQQVQVIYTGPALVYPEDGTIFKQSHTLGFLDDKPLRLRWTPVVPAPPINDLLYTIKIYEVNTGQQPAQAIMSNSPVFEKTLKNTQTIWQIPSEYKSSIENKRIVWTVQATNNQGNGYGANNGKSEVKGFTILPLTANQPPVVINSTPVSCITTSNTAFHTGDIIHLSDGFELKFTTDPTGTNDSLSGKGTVYVKWLGLLNVKFKGIKINAQDQLCSGSVYTNTDSSQVYPTQWAVNVLGNPNWGSWTETKIKGVCAGIKANIPFKPLVKATDQVNTILTVVPLNMPLGYFKANDTTTSIGFTEMVFSADHAEFEVIASLPAKGIFKHSNGTDVIALRGNGIHFTSRGLSGITGSIKLLDPVSFSYATGNEYLKLTFNKEGAGHLGNGIVFSAVNNEFWKYDFDVNVELPKEWLVPVDPAKTNVDMNFQLEIAQWSDFILQGNLPACTIPHSNGIGLEAGLITYDHSSITNVTNMAFPTGYLGDTNAMFSGFYMKNFKFTLPDELRSYEDTSKKIQIIAENLIIDQYGITGKIFAANVLMYPKANIGNLGASIDTVTINLSYNVLTDAKMVGQITLPISSTDDIANAINYSVLFLPSGGIGPANSSSLTFALKPNRDIKSKFFGDGKIQINQTSSFSLILSRSSMNVRDVNLNIDLNGKLYYPTGKILDPGGNIPIDLDLSCDFEHFGMSYSKNAAENFSFNTGHWSFASPQKKILGFSYTISDIKFKYDAIVPITDPSTSATDYLFKGGLELKATINIGSDKVSVCGETKIKIQGGVISYRYGTTSVTGLSTVRQDWRFLTHLKSAFIGIKVEDVGVDVKIAAAEIKGNVKLYKNDPVFGNAFKGDVAVKFKTLNLAVQAGAIFGNTKYIPGNTLPAFKYWMVQAQVNLPTPGIVFMPGIVFRGFGAGVYSRMHMTPPAVLNPVTAASSTFGGAIFTPDYSVSVGFKVKAIIATTPKEETFNGSVALGAQFNTNGGIDFIQVDGLFNCGSKIGQENKAFAFGGLTCTYDFPHKVFDAGLTLNIEKAPVLATNGAVQAKLHIDGTYNKWFFKFGTPTHPNKLKILGVGVNSYMEFGNDIEIPGGFMQETRDGFTTLGYNIPFTDNATGEGKYQSAKGFAFGIGVNYQHSDTWNIASVSSYFVNVNYGIDAGGEIDASFLQYSGCEAYGNGLGEGWRAGCSMALYAGASLGYAYNLPYPIGSGSGPLITAKSAVYATAEFPNPTYFEGDVSGDIEIPGIPKKYSPHFARHFKFGDHCAGSTVNDPGNQNVYTQQDVGDSLSYTLIKNIITPGATGVLRTTDFSVLLNYPYNESFDVQEQQSDGQLKVRTFRAFYTATLTQDSITSIPNTINRNAPVTENRINQSQRTSTNTGTISRVQNQISPQTTTRHSTFNNTTRSTVTMQMNPAVALALSLSLIDAGYDELGAKLFILEALSNGGISNAPVNALKPNTTFKFKIDGVLQEYIGNAWVAVNHKNTSTPIKQTKSIYFKTNSDAVSNSAIINR